jgi:DNA-binding NarL/FixJ family response regulator
VRVAIAEDNPVYRAGLVGLLHATGMDVLHEAASGSELLAQLRGGALPDVAILDIQMAGIDDDGLNTARILRQQHPGVGVLLLSAYAEPAYAERLFQHGSSGRGYMLKDTLNSVVQLKEALTRIHEGLTYTDPKVLDQLVAGGRPASTSPLDELSPRERTVLTLVAAGASNSAIAATIRSSVGATETAIRNIYNKLAIPDSPEFNRRVLAVLKFHSM